MRQKGLRGRGASRQEEDEEGEAGQGHELPKGLVFVLVGLLALCCVTLIAVLVLGLPLSEIGGPYVVPVAAIGLMFTVLAVK